MNNTAQNIAALQMITHGDPVQIKRQVEQACGAGLKWVQLRAKELDESSMLKLAEDLKEITQKHGAKLIINDMVEIAERLDADGVHLGKQDLAPDKARVILGPDKIIGGTANTTQDIDRLVELGVDYIGYGPFRKTKTKVKLSPVLGLKGYKEALQHCHKRDYDIPVIAIGGIEVDDVGPLMNTGVHGIAVSSALVGNGMTEENTRRFLKALDEAGMTASSF